jgi:hypothetical protein
MFVKLAAPLYLGVASNECWLVGVAVNCVDGKPKRIRLKPKVIFRY